MRGGFVQDFCCDLSWGACWYLYSSTLHFTFCPASYFSGIKTREEERGRRKERRGEDIRGGKGGRKKIEEKEDKREEKAWHLTVEFILPKRHFLLFM